MRTYARALRKGKKLSRPVQDTSQLGGHGILVDGTVVQVWRPRTPDDRPAAADVGAADQLVAKPPPDH